MHRTRSSLAAMGLIARPGPIVPTGANPTWIESANSIQVIEFARLVLSGANPQQADWLQAAGAVTATHLPSP
ncbi:hypothetical protein CHELA40_13360 [Chelatococcus asaccharovorans]|nr:hypothetical protein CHELA40_13360 [Chelatococcus asaccharovorans]CAH1678550.1 hypothetical protein CHELA17_62258 [Chelatococcus asaccharovorans]